jgi:2-polyprenyl-3-methyl-5-hydroxy-6-metoxy-1,4-benzoquinol methylase
MFKVRSHKKELLDQEYIPEKDLFQNLKELDVINNLLGGYAISFNVLKQIAQKNKTFTLVDIGSGGGDTLKRINTWAMKNSYIIQLTGIDLKQACIDYSQNNKPNNKIQFICDDYRNAFNHIKKIDVLHACLFCHHLNNNELIELIKFSNKNNTTLVINDLERNPIAYYAIKTLTALFSKSYLVKNDAPLSVLRGFKKTEWLQIIKEAGALNYSVNWKWAFRHQIIIHANSSK